MKYESVKKIAYYTVAACGVLALAYLFLRYVFLIVLPFLIAWAVAYAVERPAAFLHRRIGMPEGVWRVILAIGAIALILGLAVLGIWRLSAELWELFSNGGSAELESIVARVVGENGLIGNILGGLGDTIGDALYSIAMSLMESVGNFLSAFVGGVPRAMLFLLITVISCIYFALDLESIADFLRRILPVRIRDFLAGLKRSFFSVGVRYIRAYFLLLLITFAVMLTGLSILRAPYALLVALIISFLDLLPVIGVGTALIPWSIYSFIVGDSRLAVGLLILYVIHTVIRQFAEPKIVGKNLGVHPIVTLIFLYAGYSLFGFVGLLLVPLFTVVFDIAVGKKNAAKVDEPTASE